MIGVVETPQRMRRALPILLVTASVIALVPVDFVRVSATWRYAGLVSLLFGAVVAVWCVHRSDVSIVRPALIFGFLVVAFNQLMNFNPVGFVTLLAPVVVGAGLAVAVRNPLALLVALSVLLATSMAVEFVVQQHLFGQLFGEPNYTAYSRDTFRSRGLIGQAVPAGMVAVGVGAAGAVLSSTIEQHRTTVRWVLALSTTVSVLTSGTRSAIVCAAALALGLGAANIWRSGHGRIAIGARLAWIGPIVLAAIVTVSVLYWTVLTSQRVFSFGTLAGSASLDNRNYAALVFDEWGETCSGACIAFGSGARSLLDALGGGLGFRGFTTVDNLFLSLLWDFGIIMLVGLAVLVFVAIRTLLQSNSIHARAGAVLILSVVLSGLFYDSLYIRPVLLLFGFGIGLLGAKVKNNDS